MSSNTIDYTVTMDAIAVVGKLTSVAMGLDSYLNSVLVNAAYATNEEMKSKAPVGVGGSMGAGLQGSIRTTYDVVAGSGNHSALIAPTAPYAAYVETGTRPHSPPAGPDSSLAQWCEMKGLNLWAVVTSIRRKGTQPHPYVEPTYRVMEPIVEAMFDDGIAQYISEAAA
jgi:HK97 gp10 family phage protein